MRKWSSVLRVLIGLPGGIAICAQAQAEQPFGWIGNGHTSAYTLRAGEFELSGNLLKVNDTIDVLDVRDELVAGNRRLIGNSGDLDGFRGEIRVGVWHGLELFYRQQHQDLTLKIAPVASADIIDLDQELSTRSTAYGAKWVFYESASRNRNRPWTSAALELSRVENRSDDFQGFLKSVRLNQFTTVTFNDGQRFAMDRLQDEGWQARLLMSRPLGQSTALSLWAGYGESESSSGTSSTIAFNFLREAFAQTFDIEEKQVMLGASLNWQYFPRLPVQIGYEYIRINSRSEDIVASTSSFLPSFLRGDNLGNSATKNHTLYGSVNWWLNPHVYVGAGGKLFSNQFVGVMPHYNNPLSGSFSDTTYGYVELKLGVKFAVQNWR